MRALEQLTELREYGGERSTVGLEDDVLVSFLDEDPALARAIDRAYEAHQAMREEWGEALARPEAELVTWLQADYVNFYPPETVNPYVPIAAAGPWIVTSHGAVVHDNGGYGMLGLGHAPDGVVDAMGAPFVMANVMTASVSHRRFTDRLAREIGQRRADGNPFSRFVCLNSGSEAVSVAARIADHHALLQVDHGGPREGAKVMSLSLDGSFHGRTDRPAQVSDSTLPKYRAALYSFRERDNLLTCPPNDVEALRRVFADAQDDGVFIDMMYMEPVMGEGNPGQAITRAFYDAARELTLQHGSMLMIDSIQAGFRATGYLSLVDYPGFEDCVAPDMETWSKALNAGQYPLSVLGLTGRAADQYVQGVYGNTMTTNPRALEVGSAVLDRITPALRANIVERGAQLARGLEALHDEFPGLVTKVQGTGLLVSAELDPEHISVVGFSGIEMWCRQHGLGVIHGGKNALRFTPHFAITAREIELVLRVVRQGIRAMMGVHAPLDMERERVLAERG